MKKKAGFILILILLVIVDDLLFMRYELVWPFFWMPYAVLFLIYFFCYVVNKKHTLFMIAVNIIIIIPVFAGFIMSVAWMIKINFWGEIIGGLFG